MVKMGNLLEIPQSALKRYGRFKNLAQCSNTWKAQCSNLKNTTSWDVSEEMSVFDDNCW